MAAHNRHAQFTRQRGFTLIELLVTIAILAILGALAVPSMRSFFIRNGFAGIGNEFNGGVLRARNEAVSKNICVTMCLSTNADSTSSSAPPSCAGTGTDWQQGWIVFLNPECDASLNKPTEKNAAGTAVDKPENMLIARTAGNTNYRLTGNVNKILFNARGQTDIAASSSGLFILSYVPSTDLTTSYGFNICVDRLGRSRSVPVSVAAVATCLSY
ncbi:hypothetical protein RD110_14405 [Rhodoferax koreense]|uniref:Type II secretion system protein H n=1 Tax=Rhodoferax koreensis TaxID=1842727 RepID=A0A1P8K443_9BURK|nr:GspH/FimT family pseudopilin [Rhodoferax koreense]APW40701.1 hypothetical protein RD110_14405 [Rhodoferax koreense]